MRLGFHRLSSERSGNQDTRLIQGSLAGHGSERRGPRRTYPRPCRLPSLESATVVRANCQAMFMMSLPRARRSVEERDHRLRQRGRTEDVVVR